MNQSKVSSSLVNSGAKYPEVLEEVKGKKFEELIAPPKKLSTPKRRFSLQRKIYKNMSQETDITWEEALHGLKPLPSYTAPSEFYEGLKIVKNMEFSPVIS